MATQKQDEFLYKDKLFEDVDWATHFLRIHAANDANKITLYKYARWSLCRSVLSILFASLILWLALFSVVYLLSVIW